MCQQLCQKMCRHYSTQQKNYPIKNLLLRNNIFYYRYRIYVNGVAKDKRISLHTTDYIEAVGTMLDIERKCRLEKQLEKIDQSMVDCSEDLDTYVQLQNQRNVIQNALDKINQQMSGHITVNPKSQHIKPMCSPENHTSKSIPSIQELLTEFLHVKHYDSSTKKGHGWKITKNLNRIFSENNISLEKPITVLNDQKIIIKIVDSIANYTESHGQKISADSQANHLGPFKNFLEYCNAFVDSRIISVIHIPKSRKRDKIPHSAYSQEALIKMFDPNIEKSIFKKQPYIFWAVMISLFTGARKNAATTLQYNHIREINGIKCIEFIANHPNKTLKNDASERIVPIAKQLLDLGFWEWVQHRKQYLQAQDTDFIFPECFVQKPTNDIQNYGMWRDSCIRIFFDFLITIQIKHSDFQKIKETREKYDFHSFRKNANQILKAHSIPVDKINMIIGWEAENLSDGTYNIDPYSETAIPELQQIIDSALKYDFLQKSFDKWKHILVDKYQCKTTTPPAGWVPFEQRAK